MKRHVSVFEPYTLVVSVIVTAFAALVCMTIMGRLGIVPNTSIIGALVAITLGRTVAGAFRSLDRQNLVQTMCSGGGFGAGNAIFVPFTVIFLMGRMDLMVPMLAGAGLGALFSVWMIGKIFDSQPFPASYPWPPGVATAAAIVAGDEGGKKARDLFLGLSAGVLGGVFKVPMAGFGIAFIADSWAMIALGVGLILRGYSPDLFNGFDLGKTYIPHGIMIGGSIAQLWQTTKVLLAKKAEGSGGNSDTPEVTVSQEAARKAIGQSLGLFLVGVAVIIFLGGLMSDMSAGKLVLCLVWGGIGAWLTSILCGMCAMNSGWFPSTSIVVIFLMLSILIGFPAIVLAVLAGYFSTTGACFADMGYDLKTGWLLRKREGFDLGYELEGRKQQVYAELIGVFIGILAVAAFGKMYLNQGLVPPFPKVFKAAIEAGTSPEILKTMALWAIPGAILQFVSGPRRAMGILLGVGLLIKSPLYGISCLAGVFVRYFWEKKMGGEEVAQIRAAGIVAGDGIWGFFNALWRAIA